MTLAVFIFGWFALAIFLLLGVAVAAGKSSRENDREWVPQRASMREEPPVQPHYEPAVIQ